LVNSELSPSAGAFEEVRRTPYTLRPGETATFVWG
jgi:hypothetical protein